MLIFLSASAGASTIAPWRSALGKDWGKGGQHVWSIAKNFLDKLEIARTSMRALLPRPGIFPLGFQHQLTIKKDGYLFQQTA